jgi:GH43 family beta-xylosidase
MVPRLLISLLLLSADLFLYQLTAQNNPVIERVADAGAINFNGMYYLAGVSTNGGFYISDDLVHWKGPVHVFSMNNEWTSGRSAGDNQIHAADIHYWNGKFHFYWSVNYWGVKDMVVHIGHAVSDNILGPYSEPVKKNWFADRIDAELFIDDDSTFYFYTVKFTDGNTIWGQPMKDPWNLKGEPELLYTSLPGTWERFDNNVIEGPWVIKYRMKYYMMYNANHTSNRWGNYALGIAQSDKPLGFNSGNKYPQPVVQSNLTDNPEEFRYYFKNSSELFDNWLFTFDNPGDGWINSDFVDSGWKSGKKGFGNQVVQGSSIVRKQTDWNNEDIWVRKTFSLTPLPTDNLQLLVYHSGPTEVYIDGEIVYSNSGANYSTVDLGKAVIGKLRAGKNLISIHSKISRRQAHLDLDLVDPLTGPGDDILFNPGQPNIVRGPNGFEWWLIYFGIKNGGPRGQFVNRVTFHDRELTVDGPTGNKTPGYHPDPALPVFGDLFDQPGNDQFISRWVTNKGTWLIDNGELMQTDSLLRTRSIIKSGIASDYLFKAGVKNLSRKKGSSGVIAYYLDPSNLIEIGLNQSEGTWYSRIVKGGKEQLKKIKLSGDFNFNVYHSLTVLKNEKRFEILIDDNPAPGSYVLESPFAGKGIPGLFTANCKAAFDGVIFTPGWDEFDSSVTGWKNSEKGDKMSGIWTVSENGISQSQENGSFSSFKGDLLEQYEFGTQLYSGLRGEDVPEQCSSGIYPVYIDKDNYLQAGLDFKNGNLIISGKKDNKEIVNKVLPLRRILCKYPDPKYGDGFSKVYTLKKNTEISSVEIVKSIYNRADFSVNLFDSLKIYYKNSGEWRPLDFRIVPGDDHALDKIEFNRITADALKIVSSAIDNSVHVYKLFITEDITSDYNLRSVKLNDRVILFLDDKQIAEIKASWPASQVGLFCRDMPARFNGITLFEKR